MPNEESDPSIRIGAHLERWESDHLHGNARVVIKLGKHTGPVPLDEFVSTRLTFQYAVNDLADTLLVGLRENLAYEEREVNGLQLRRGDAHREFKIRAERVSKRHVDGFKEAIAKLRSTTNDRWNEYEHPLSEDEIEALTKVFVTRARELCRESVSAYLAIVSRQTNTLQPSRLVSDQIRARRQLIRKYLTQHEERLTMASLAWRATTSVTAIQGMVRGDRTRYSQDTLERFLKTIGVSLQDWER